MRITSVHAPPRRRGQRPDGPRGARRARARGRAQATLCDDRGNLGVSEDHRSPGSPDTVEEAAAALEAAGASLVDQTLPESLADIAFDAPSPAARFAMESALLDLLGRRQGVPARSLLGAPRAVAISGYGGPAHATGVVAAVRALLDAGSRTMKVKVGGGSFEADRAAIARLRGELGDAWTLRLDANGAWSLGEDEACTRILAYDEAVGRP
ncbi:MAG: mandelate racemase/muconate lactonizing enzyme family protein [Polyangiales bacterium]